MGLDKPNGPDDLPIEAVKILAKQDIGYVVEAMNQVLQQRIPEIWYHSMKLWERLIEARLRQITSKGNTQYGIRPGKSTTEPIFIL